MVRWGRDQLNTRHLGLQRKGNMSYKHVNLMSKCVCLSICIYRHVPVCVWVTGKFAITQYIYSDIWCIVISLLDSDSTVRDNGDSWAAHAVPQAGDVLIHLQGRKPSVPARPSGPGVVLPPLAWRLERSSEGLGGNFRMRVK